MASKRHIFQDPEYEEYPAEIQEKRAKLFERNARNATVKKIVAIMKSEFQQELCFYDKQLEDIDEAIHETRNALDRVRACAVAKYFYSTSKETDYDGSSTPSIHPTVKNYLGKAPTHLSSAIKTEHVVNKIPEQSLQENLSSSASKVCLQKSVQEEALENSSLQSNTDEAGCRVSRFKSKYRIIIGNSSKFITASRREENDQSTHKWLVYVKGEKNGPTVETFVKKVIFLLHSSYRPNDVVEVSFPPFHLVRRGWGEFPVRVQLHFKNYRNKPVDVIHNLKLDKTYTGLQTFGAETVVELQLYKNDVIVPSLETVDLPVMLSGSNTFNINSVCASDDGHNSTFSHCQTQSPKKNIWKGKELLSETNASSVFISAANDTNSTKDNKDTVEVNSTNNKSANIIPALAEQSSDSKMHKASDFAILHKNQILNGTNTFIKCTDSQGRTLLVPHSSLIRMNSFNSETCIKQVDSLHIPSNSNQSPGTLPSYILKVIPNVKSGPNQVLLIPVSENKQNNTSNTNSQLIMCSEKQSSKFSTNGVPPHVTDSTFDNSHHTPVRRTVPYVHWERALAEINLDSIKIFTDLLKKILKIFPLITEEADLSATPFCAPSLEIFQSWNIGKQRASEWQRAGIVRATILRLLKSKNSVIKLEDVWSRKKIMVWCRKYAYTPSFNGKTNVDKMNIDKMNIEEVEPWSGSFFADAPKVSDVQRILAMIESIKNSNPTSHNVDEEIDVVSIDSKESPEVHCSKPIHSQVILPHSSPCAKYVQECASMVNIKLKPIELQPSICVPVIEEMILAACKEYILDIIRESYNQGYVRMGGKLCPDQVIVKDIVNAFRNNPRLDLGSCNMSVIPEATEES